MNTLNQQLDKYLNRTRPPRDVNVSIVESEYGRMGYYTATDGTKVFRRECDVMDDEYREFIKEHTKDDNKKFDPRF